MLEELQTPPSEAEAPVEDTQGEEAESVLDGAEVEEGQESHPEEESEGGQKEEPFYVEGDKIFQTKEDFIKHFNKQRGAASQLASQYKRTQARLEELERALSQKEQATPQKAKEDTQEEELPVEQLEALQTIKKYGKFLTPDELQTILEQQLAPVRNILSTFEQQRMKEAETFVSSFLEMNPDANDIREELADTMERMDKAGISGGIEKAYLLVTGKQPKTQEAMKKEAEKRVVKKMQAGGASGSSSGAMKTEQDLLAQILNYS